MDQVSTPTYADDLAAAVITLAAARPGVWHAAGRDRISRVELAYRVCEVFDLPPALVIATPTAKLRQTAARPLRAGLRSERYERAFGQAPVRRLRDALADLRRCLR